MGIVPAFDPATGASGGPAAGDGGESLYGLEFTEIDLTDGSWTLLDPDSLVDTVSFSGGYNTIVWNALAAGSADYIWTGANNRAPRWYKKLSIDGTDVVSDDIFALAMLMEADDTFTDFNQRAVMGAAVDPTSLLSATIKCAGSVFTRAGAGNQTYGAFTINSQTTATAATARKMVGMAQLGAQYLGTSIYHILDASNVRVQSGSRNATSVVATGTDIYLCVGVGTIFNSDTVSAGDDQRIRLGYRAVKWSLP